MGSTDVQDNVARRGRRGGGGEEEAGEQSSQKLKSPNTTSIIGFHLKNKLYIVCASSQTTPKGGKTSPTSVAAIENYMNFDHKYVWHHLKERFIT
jgi:hypothetical protein